MGDIAYQEYFLGGVSERVYFKFQMAILIRKTLGKLLNIHLLYTWCSSETHGICRLPLRKSLGIYDVCSGKTQQKIKEVMLKPAEHMAYEKQRLKNLIVGCADPERLSRNLLYKTTGEIGNMVPNRSDFGVL